MKIKLQNVCKTFGRQRVLNHLDLDIASRKITYIIGQSGGGKSVLLKHIIGLIKPDSGRIFVDDTDMCTLRERELNDIRKNFGMLFQEAALFDSMTVGDNVAFPLKEHTRLSPKEIDQIVEAKLQQVGLTDVSHKMPAELSGGMRKRVGLARAIALDPKIILFDEPTTGLDPLMCDAVDQLIADTQQQTGATCVVISHDIESTFKIAHHVAMLYGGRIIAFGTPDDIKASKNEYVQRFITGKHERS